MKNKVIYRSLLIGSFVLVNLLLLNGFGKLWSYFNSGADRSAMMHSTVSEKPMADIRWHDEIDITSGVREELGRAYLQAEAGRQKTLESRNLRYMEQHFADSLVQQHQRMLQAGGKPGLRIHEIDLDHQLFLEHFSTDGLSAALRDTAYVAFRETYENDRLLHREWDTLDLRIVMLKSDRGWKVRHRVILPRKSKVSSYRKPEWKIPPASIKGFNYYPAKNPWNLFGDDFDSSVLRSDFKKISELGMNTLRVFVPYQDFGAGAMQAEKLGQLQELLDIAEEEKLWVMLTLFDFYGDYTRADYHATSAHLRQLVQAVGKHPMLLGWDLKNEPDLDFDSRGEARVLDWLEFMHAYLIKLDGQTPVTIGWSSPEAASHLEDKLDLVSFHYYRDPMDFKSDYDRLRKETKKPILLQEFGRSSYSGIWNLWRSSEQEQADYMGALLEVCKEVSIPYLAWTLYDFQQVPKQVVGSRPWRKAPQRHYGILNEDGKPKKAFREF